MYQSSLFGGAPIQLDQRMRDCTRIDLGNGAWIEHVGNWLEGHRLVFEALSREVRWRHERRMMYERVVDVPRLVARAAPDCSMTPLLTRMSETLSLRYHFDLTRISLCNYRSGRDSVAMHGDKLGSLVSNTVVAIVSVGEPRRFVLREATGPGSYSFRLGWGDLMVMGGSCQQTWRHGVPKQRQAAPRISIMFRQEVPDVA